MTAAATKPKPTEPADTPNPELKVVAQWVAEPNYDRINTARTQARQARWAWNTAQLEAKMRKKEMEGAYEALDRVLSEEFDPPPPVPHEPNLVDGTHGPADGDDEWREVPLSSLGLAAAVVKSLTAAGLSTIGELQAWLEPNDAGFTKRLVDLDGIGAQKAETIERALEQFWVERGSDEVKETPDDQQA